MVYKLLKTSFFVCFAGLLLLQLTGCFLLLSPDDYIYKGDYPEVLTVAINSIIGTRGYNVSEIVEFPDILALETDDFGRSLFLYYENVVSLIIIQQNDEEFVYYYPYYNHISIRRLPMGINISDSLSMDDIEKSFTIEAILDFKSKNDWNQPINFDKAIRTEIVTVKNDIDGPINKRSITHTYNTVFGENAIRNPNAVFFITDNYKRSIYTAIIRDGFAGDGRRTVIMLFQPDGSLDAERGVMELNDLYQYQDDLKAFMEQNEWNEPWTK